MMGLRPACQADDTRSGAQVDQDALETQVGLVGLAAQVLADAGTLEAARGNHEVRGAAITVDPPRARSESPHEPRRPAEVGGMQTSREALLGMRRERERFFF